MKALVPTIERGEISVVGAIYHLDTGRVTLIGAEGGQLFSPQWAAHLSNH